MNKCFIIILYEVEGSEKLFTFCMVSIFRKGFRTEWFRKFVFNFNLTGFKTKIDTAILFFCIIAYYTFQLTSILLLSIA